MKIQTTVKAFKEALSALSTIPGVTATDTLPMILVIIADGFSIQLKRETSIAGGKITIEGEIEEEGQVCVSFDKAATLIGRLTEKELELTAGKDRVEVSSGKHQATLMTLKEEKVTRPKQEVITRFEAPCEKFGIRLKYASAGGTRDKGMEMFSGVTVRKYEDKLALIGCDRRKAYCYPIPEAVMIKESEEQPIDINLPPESVQMIEKMCATNTGSFVMMVSEGSVFVDFENAKILLPLFNERIADVAKLFIICAQNSDCTFTVDRKELCDAAKFTFPLNDVRKISLTPGDGSMTISAGDIIGNVFNQKAKFEPIEGKINEAIWVNGEYLANMLEGVIGETVKFQFSNSRNSLLIDTPEHTMALMCMSADKEIAQRIKDEGSEATGVQKTPIGATKGKTKKKR